MKRVKSDFIYTDEMKLHYHKVAVWLNYKNIPYRKLVQGLEVNVSNIPNDLVDEWIEISTFELWKKSK